MPNYVRNRLVIVGKTNIVKSMLNAICNKETGGIDFNKIKPMPAELHEVSSPVRIVSEAEYKKQEVKEIGGFIMGKSITKKMQKEYIKKYGADNWYDWACQNWGTKWNAGSAEEPVVEKEDGLTRATLNFETAWSCPVPIIEELSNTYPDVTIRIKFADEDISSNTGEGTIKAGVWTYKNVPKCGTSEAYDLALSMWPDMTAYYEKDKNGNWQYKEEE